MSGPQFTRPQSSGLSGLGAMLESYHKQFEDALQLICCALLEKAIDNTQKTATSKYRHVCQPVVHILNV